ncbi:O-acetyl-ADP-ribose deacetylase [Polyangium jinanense]|uniref:O-acetyl-ADP-ribose deacetylase n=1 Tax=Polyangium jinanense TaxID=2829994 RepID=A0A9X3WYD2_9BACT|nr:O-acetyl-ADP-ribose deacetylase [Polyangium jinanense]MDC3953385.1 O-acetyl-ADP-ribose deacetylase [Polyangium jinanense]MDC3979495.1 O-acetyl-ADP-ribose deacetylase [Polyangium jinanense]
MPREFAVGPCKVSLVEGDITTEDVDAIANAANAGLLGGGGVDGAIHRAAGPELVAACREVKKSLPGGLLQTGGAVITPGFRLRARHVIHCVGPVYEREGADAPKLLASCYTEALRLCREHGLSSIAFPAISTGVYGYPLDAAARVSLTAVRDDLRAHGTPSVVKMVLFGQSALSAFLRAAEEVFPAAEP